MLGASTRLGDLALGLSLSVPFGGRARWDGNDRFADHPQFPLAAEGVQRWHGIEGSLTFLYATFGVAYRLGRLALGASGNLIRSSVQDPPGQDADGRRHARYHPRRPRHPRRRRHPRQLRRRRHARSGARPAMAGRILPGAARAGPDAAGGHASPRNTGAAQTPLPVTLVQALPDIARLGLRYRLGPAVELRLSARDDPLERDADPVRGLDRATLPGGRQRRRRQPARPACCRTCGGAGTTPTAARAGAELVGRAPPWSCSWAAAPRPQPPPRDPGSRAGRRPQRQRRARAPASRSPIAAALDLADVHPFSPPRQPRQEPARGRRAPHPSPRRRRPVYPVDHVVQPQRRTALLIRPDASPSPYASPSPSPRTRDVPGRRRFGQSARCRGEPAGRASRPGDGDGDGDAYGDGNAYGRVRRVTSPITPGRAWVCSPDPAPSRRRGGGRRRRARGRGVPGRWRAWRGG